MSLQSRLAAIALSLAVLTAVPFMSLAKTPGLRVGSAKVDITPPINELAPPFTSINDPVFARAVMIDNGAARSVLVILDVPTIAAPIAADLVRDIAKAARINESNVLLGTSHTHNVMRVDYDGPSIIPGSTKLVERVKAATDKAVKEAEASLQPARVGVGRGDMNLIANRNEWFPAQSRFIDGIDRDRTQPINSKVGVIAFQDLQGKPLAFIINYAVEPVLMDNVKTEISGDLPGAVSRYIEGRLGEKVVAMFTIGAAGTPLYRSHPDPYYGQSDPRAIMSAYGTLLGEEVIETARAIRDFKSDIMIGGERDVLTCPGKRTTPLNLRKMCAHEPGSSLPACSFTTADAAPVSLSMGALKVGDVTMVQTDANVTPALGAKLAQLSPVSNTWVVALTFGPMRFVVDEAAYPLNTYEATASWAKAGCAEAGYLDKSLGLIDRLASSARK
ncbi:neutral/alkaline non-lysosomal ceramidase N-terminal domain-containing protein [Niveispirillum cyanobacteriorum]|uniref:neutral/alkaline non-lysosomal ceramidase N-terminal domain-containing protein n=1 Tax=Niveispirillum cyanobacteriorum TaxID=1612173 RepID=UPI001319E41D|nr:neutral/alkaline non-lysosomal ceramidase N-terminal domain-containing protein [Niveispirillum cyanobacteriorum]GGE82922.1 hypothetical protein GCM10011317_45180 [Niveispirillum cyanobacteriorum]